MADQKLESNQPVNDLNQFWTGLAVGAGILATGAVLATPEKVESSFEDWSKSAREKFIEQGPASLAEARQAEYARRKLIHEQIETVRQEMPHADDAAIKKAIRKLHGVDGVKASKIRL